MKVFNILLSCVLVLGLATSCKSKGPKVKDDGFVSMFDGKTTTGWRGYNKTTFPEKGWEVVDEIGRASCRERV